MHSVELQNKLSHGIQNKCALKRKRTLLEEHIEMNNNRNKPI